jgi:hypothetical protein
MLRRVVLPPLKSCDVMEAISHCRRTKNVIRLHVVTSQNSLYSHRHKKLKSHELNKTYNLLYSLVRIVYVLLQLLLERGLANL